MKEDKKISKDRIALLTLITILIIGSLVSAVWNDETITGTITQDNTSQTVCIGDTCYTDYKLSVNGSIYANGCVHIGDGKICYEER